MKHFRSIGIGLSVLATIVASGFALASLAPSSAPRSSGEIEGDVPGSSPTLGLGAEWTYVELREVPEVDRGKLFTGLDWRQSVKAKRIGGEMFLVRHEADLKDRAALEGFLSASGTQTVFGQNKAHWATHPALGTGLVFLGIREAAFLTSPSLAPSAPVPEELASYLATISVP